LWSGRLGKAGTAVTVKTGRQRAPGETEPDPQVDAALAGDSTLIVLSQAQQGDRSAVRILIERALPPVRRWAHGRIPPEGRSEANTEDVLQDAVLRTLKRAPQFQYRTVDSLQRYLRVSVINTIRDIARRIRRRGAPLEVSEALPDGSVSPEDESILRERYAIFAEALGRMRSATDRQMIIWRFELGYSYEEIADKSGKSVDAARVAVSRAISRLRKELASTIASRKSRATTKTP
jgi:RNA polymerase sigma-70 factor (ECF subfamily)